MKFGKNLVQVIEFSDPEWGPYWMNYKYLKKKINDIVNEQGGIKMSNPSQSTDPLILSKSSAEVEFFRLLKSELKKTNDFFKAEEGLFRIRRARVWEGFNLLKENAQYSDKTTWTRLSMACVKFYEDVLLLENFAIMNYCGFSKILKKHDKLTGFWTREAFMRNTMEHQSFTHHESVIQMLKDAEDLFMNIQNMKSAIPLKEEEKLFIEAIRDLNYQASRVRAEEKESIQTDSSSKNLPGDIKKEVETTLTIASTLFPHAQPASSPTNEKDYDDNASSGQNDSESKPLTGFGGQTASEGLQAATDALAAVARKTYLSQTLPNLTSAISWIHNVSSTNNNGSVSGTTHINDENTATATTTATYSPNTGLTTSTSYMDNNSYILTSTNDSLAYYSMYNGEPSKRTRAFSSPAPVLIEPELKRIRR